MMIRSFSLLIVLGTIVVNMFALAGLLQDTGFANTAWQAPFSTLGNLYTELAASGFSIANTFATSQFGFELPSWSMHAFVLYASTALAVASSGMGVTSRATILESLGSGGVSLAWPVSLWAFVTQAFRGRAVSNFARDHSLIFWLYMLTVAAGYGGARYLNETYLETALMLQILAVG